MKTRNSVPSLALRWVIVLVAILVLAIAGILIANRTIFSAQHQVKVLQQHMAAGEGGKALGLLRASVPEGNAVALNGDVLKHTQEGITDFSVAPAVTDEHDSDLVEVKATYQAEGTEHSSTYRLHRAGKSWLFFDQWEFVPDSLPTIQVRANTVNEVSLNKEKIPLDQGISTIPVFYPAVINASFETKNFKADTRGVVVTGPTKDPVPVKLTTEPTKAFLSAINKKLKTYVDGCASQKVLMPAGCPMAYHTSARVNSQSINWTITDYPKAKVSYYNGAWVLAPLEFEAQLQLTEQDLRTGATEKKTVKETYNFTAQLTTSTTKVSVVPVAAVENAAN
ncbi:hypothetical protein [Glutamicibacter endophyticus]|uniref:hypothetical protein n=1 Tax=Glutamicibacter endophyticus TaxID=1522174 RepID=UPI003AF1DB82